MAAELLACHGAHNTDELQAGRKAQWRRVTRLKIPKCFMQAWNIIVREMKCVCSEPKLLAGRWLGRVMEMLTGREKFLYFMYTRGVFHAMVFQSLNLQAFFRCPRYYLFMWETISYVLGPGISERGEFWASGGAQSLILCAGNMGSIALKLLLYYYWLIGNLCSVIFIGLFWGKKKEGDEP